MESKLLCHYGVKGQKWGVRRFQNKDGTLTSAGKKRQIAAKNYRYVSKTLDEVQRIVDTISDNERKLLGVTDGTYMNPDEVKYVAKRFIKRVGKEPVAFLDVFYGGDGHGNISVATKSDEWYRHKGYANELVSKAQNWINKQTTKDLYGIDSLVWTANVSNNPSIGLAEKREFIKDLNKSVDDLWYGVYKCRS